MTVDVAGSRQQVAKGTHEARLSSHTPCYVLRATCSPRLKGVVHSG